MIRVAVGAVDYIRARERQIDIRRRRVLGRHRRIPLHEGTCLQPERREAVDVEEAGDRHVRRFAVPAIVPRIGRAEEHLAVVGRQPELQSTVDATRIDVGLPDLFPRGGIETEEPAVLVAADHDVAAFAVAELDVFHELRLLAEPHIRADRSLGAIGYSIRERHREERRHHRRPAIQVRRAARVIPGVVLARVKSPFDAPAIHVDRDHGVRVDMQLLVQVVAGHARRQARNVRVGIAATAPGLLAVLRDLRRRCRLRHGDIDLAPLHIDRRIVAVGRSAKGSLGLQQRSQRRRQFVIGVIADVGMSLPENLPGIDIHGN